MTIDLILNRYADLLDALELPGNDQEERRSEAQQLGQETNQLLASYGDSQGALLLSEIASSCQALAAGVEFNSQMLGRNGLRTRLGELGLLG